MNDDITQIELNDKESTEPPPEGWVQVPCMRGIYEIEPVLDLLDKHGGRIIGGYARYCCSTNEKPYKAGDVDVFPVGATQEESEAVYKALSEAFKAAGLEIKHENNVSQSYLIPTTPPFNRCQTIQLIKPIIEGAVVTRGTVEEILGSFDFTIVRVALNPDRKTATAWASFEDDEKKKKLRILNIHCPISSLLRIMKYGRKGYYMRPVEVLKLLQNWEERTPEYRARIAALFTTGQMGDITQQEIDELEKLLRVD